MAYRERVVKAETSRVQDGPCQNGCDEVMGRVEVQRSAADGCRGVLTVGKMGLSSSKRV